MENAHQEPRPALRQRGSAPQVDVMDVGAAGELVLTIHVKTGHDQSHNSSSRAPRPVGFRRAIAAAVQDVVDELMPFPALAAEASQAPAGVTEQEFVGSEASEDGPAAAEGASATQESQP